MDEQVVDQVASQLRQLGLTDDVFGGEEIAADLAERAALSATLEDLIDSAGVSADPTTFHPGWDR